MTPRISLVVPCYNEAARLDLAAFEHFASAGCAHLVLVDDGSTDATRERLDEVRSAAPDRVTVLGLERNSGKAEAVRLGLLEAVRSEATYVGYWDADLATPFAELEAFVALLDARPTLDIVIGSRVRLLGRSIERRALRHYAGRAFATAVSLALRLPIYDTQCGAKVFRVTPALRSALAEPFRSRWIFDVELLARLGAADVAYDPRRLLRSVYEYPLREWRDVAGSNVRLRDVPVAAMDLLRLYRAYLW